MSVYSMESAWRGRLNARKLSGLSASGPRFEPGASRVATTRVVTLCYDDQNKSIMT
jgi:hypothetical protein